MKSRSIKHKRIHSKSRRRRFVRLSKNTPNRKHDIPDRSRSLSKNIPKGLRFGDVMIHRITGPITLRVLTSPSKPPVILFGDYHGIFNTYCAPCDEYKGCYNIGSTMFVNVLNVISRQYQIDFYLEYWLYGVHDTFRTYIKRLYQHAIKRSTTEGKYDFGWNIQEGDVRWHLVDLRYDMINNVCRDIFCEITLISEFMDIDNKQRIMRDYIGNKQIISILHDYNARRPLTIAKVREFTDFLKDINHSVITLKQVEKMDLESQIKWKTRYYPAYIEYFYNDLLERLIADGDDLNEGIDYGVFFSEMAVCGLDLYFLTRAFKIQGTEIIMAYFGEFHSQNIAYFLMNIMEPPYQLVYAQEESAGKPVQCIDIKKDIKIK